MRNALIALVAALGLTASAVYLYPGVAILTAVKVRTFFSDMQIAPAWEIAMAASGTGVSIVSSTWRVVYASSAHARRPRRP